MIYCISCDPAKKYLVHLCYENDILETTVVDDKYVEILHAKDFYALYTWDINNGFIATEDFDVGHLEKKYIVNKNNNVRVIVPKKMLAEYSKVTGYDYVPRGCLIYSVVLTSVDVFYIPMHVLTNDSNVTFDVGYVAYTVIKTFGACYLMTTMIIDEATDKTVRVVNKGLLDITTLRELDVYSNRFRTIYVPCKIAMQVAQRCEQITDVMIVCNDE